jgi:hypothetical protein
MELLALDTVVATVLTISQRAKWNAMLGLTAPDFTDVKPLFQDDFDDPASGFPEQKTGQVQQGYGAGRYFIRPQLESGFWAWNCPVGKCENFGCEVVGRAIGKPEDGWGLCITNQENNNHGIQVTLTAAGDVFVGPGHFDPEPHRGPNPGPIRHSAVRAGDALNKILVTVRGRTVCVYVNSVAVGEPITVDRDIAPGVVALCCVPRRGGSAEFERVAIWPLPERAADAPPAP